jgi:hypothetical protein
MAHTKRAEKASKSGALLRVAGVESRSRGVPWRERHRALAASYLAAGRCEPRTVFRFPEKGAHPGPWAPSRGCKKSEEGVFDGRGRANRWSAGWTQFGAARGRREPNSPAASTPPCARPRRPAALFSRSGDQKPTRRAGCFPVMPTRGPGVWALTPGPPRAHGAIGACFHPKQLRPAPGATAASLLASLC